MEMVDCEVLRDDLGNAFQHPQVCLVTVGSRAITPASAVVPASTWVFRPG